MLFFSSPIEVILKNNGPDLISLLALFVSCISLWYTFSRNKLRLYFESQKEPVQVRSLLLDDQYTDQIDTYIFTIGVLNSSKFNTLLYEIKTKNEKGESCEDVFFKKNLNTESSYIMINDNAYSKVLNNSEVELKSESFKKISFIKKVPANSQSVTFSIHTTKFTLRSKIQTWWNDHKGHRIDVLFGRHALTPKPATIYKTFYLSDAK